MMVDFLGQPEAATLIEQAVIENLVAGQVCTPDIGGKATTVQVGDDIAQRILRNRNPS